MRLPDSAHTSRPWRIHEIAPDFRIEDVWALPTPGGPGDFPRLIELVTSMGPVTELIPRRTRSLRHPLEDGELLGWDEGPAPDAE